ncbi:SusC/RagA family TonB-linked outer membrane protein [uncultured Parabacteroides sp.]|uniref:SusC/RagA family TonB-linked outer membrane protein n=1 Tax=uncultured Parabacteroides sp. TaxID=512312 RepID=UPI0025854294|nr:SusC/RagA family TonB-linked outer membrane protein [uncultured Parabacteroides sp.]
MNKRSDNRPKHEKNGRFKHVLTTIICFLLLSVPVFAQISIDIKGQTIKQALKTIESKSSYTFFYNSKFTELDKKVSLKVTDQSIDFVLGKLLSGTRLTFEKKENNQIVLIPEATRQEQVQSERTRRISGIVADQNGEPIIGANVVEKGTNNGTITDVDGSYSLEVQPKAVLLVSYIGYITKEIPVGTNTTLTINLSEDTQNLDEVVVIGYGTQKKASLTGSISSVKVSEELQSLSSSNMSSVLAGTMSGLRINNATGVPGVASKIQIRNAGSWNDAPAVFVIDGVVREKDDFDRLDVNEVENVTVLKDAASAAIYGSRASGGVVLVTTRQGKEGKPQIRYTGSYAVETPGVEMERTTGYETALLCNYIHRNNKGFWYYWDDEELEYMRNLNGGDGFDVLDDSYVNPMSTHHSLTLSGGSERVKYFINGSYFNQSGFLKKMDYSRYNIRANLEAAVNKNLTLVTQLASSYGNKNNISWGFGEDMSGIYTHLRCIQPDYRSTTSDGKPVDWGWVGNLKEFSNEANSGYNKDENQMSDVLLRLEYKIPYVEGLKAKAQFSYSYQNMYNKTFNKKQDLYTVKKEGSHGHIWTDEVIGTIKSSEPAKEYISQRSDRFKFYQLNLQLDYARTFGKHDIAALFVYEQRESWGRKFNGARENFPVLIKDQWFATSSARSDSYVDGSDEEKGRLSYIGQANYGFDNKYLLNLSLRVDGSMNFPKGKQYGYFPAASAAWIISREDFFKSDDIQLLKLRASVGLTGNDNIIGWQWQESYKYGSNAYLGTTPATNPGIQFSGIVNPNVTWEKSLSYNIGVDMYLKDKWVFNIDGWFRNTYDILGDRILSIPTSFGFTMPKENYGEVHSRGIDLEASYKDKIKNVSYYVKGIFSYATNEVIKRDFVQDAPDYDNPIGRPLNYIKGYRDAGIIRNQQQLDELNASYKQQFGQDHEYTVFGYKPELGMLIYKDLSGPNGVPDGKIDSYDQDVICNYSAPPFSVGLTLGAEWKGISIEALFQGDFGYKRGLDSRYLNLYEWNRMPRKWMDHWSEETPNAYFPDPKGADSFKSYNYTSTFTIHNASFVKMRYLNVAYRLPKPVLNYIGFIDNARLFFSATNLLTITKFDFWDPELPSTGSYPNMRSFNFGIDITF